MNLKHTVYHGFNGYREIFNEIQCILMFHFFSFFLFSLSSFLNNGNNKILFTLADCWLLKECINLAFGAVDYEHCARSDLTCCFGMKKRGSVGEYTLIHVPHNMKFVTLYLSALSHSFRIVSRSINENRHNTSTQKATKAHKKKTKHTHTHTINTLSPIRISNWPYHVNAKHTSQLVRYFLRIHFIHLFFVIVAVLLYYYFPRYPMASSRFRTQQIMKYNMRPIK